MATAASPLRVYYGGTFDPIHEGHLAIARVARDGLQAQVHLVPAADPPHRPPPGASAAQRARMVALAIAGEPGLELDELEIVRARDRPQRPSYTVDTLAQLRATLGDDVPLAWLIGGDSLASLASWHRWQRLFELAHIVVVPRPGNELPRQLPRALAEVVDGGAWCMDAARLQRQPAGLLHALSMPLRGESSTAVRAALASGEAADGQVPAAVAAFIARHRLYGVHGR